MKCGVYSYRSAAGRKVFYRLSEEFARARPWYSFEGDCECDARVRFSDGEIVGRTAPRQPEDRMRGLGDLVAAGIKLVTFGMVQPCSGCEKRRDLLNDMVPFGRRET